MLMIHLQKSRLLEQALFYEKGKWWWFVHRSVDSLNRLFLKMRTASGDESFTKESGLWIRSFLRTDTHIWGILNVLCVVDVAASWGLTLWQLYEYIPDFCSAFLLFLSIFHLFYRFTFRPVDGESVCWFVVSGLLFSSRQMTALMPFPPSVICDRQSRGTLRAEIVGVESHGDVNADVSATPRTQ